MSDIRFVCKRCGRAFIWSDGEQRYFRDNGLHPPKHCPKCRAERKGESMEPPQAQQRGRSPEPQQEQVRADAIWPQVVLISLAAAGAIVVLWWLFL
jgi:hypothetical protein